MAAARRLCWPVAADQPRRRPRRARPCWTPGGTAVPTPAAHRAQLCDRPMATQPGRRLPGLSGRRSDRCARQAGRAQGRGRRAVTMGACKVRRGCDGHSSRGRCMRPGAEPWVPSVQPTCNATHARTHIHTHTHTHAHALHSALCRRRRSWNCDAPAPKTHARAPSDGAGIPRRPDDSLQSPSTGARQGRSFEQAAQAAGGGRGHAPSVERRAAQGRQAGDAAAPAGTGVRRPVSPAFRAAGAAGGAAPRGGADAAAGACFLTALGMHRARRVCNGCAGVAIAPSDRHACEAGRGRAKPPMLMIMLLRGGGVCMEPCTVWLAELGSTWGAMPTDRQPRNVKALENNIVSEENWGSRVRGCLGAQTTSATLHRKGGGPKEKLLACLVGSLGSECYESFWQTKRAAGASGHDRLSASTAGRAGACTQSQDAHGQERARPSHLHAHGTGCLVSRCLRESYLNRASSSAISRWYRWRMTGRQGLSVRVSVPSSMLWQAAGCEGRRCRGRAFCHGMLRCSFAQACLRAAAGAAAAAAAPTPCPVPHTRAHRSSGRHLCT